MGGGSSVKTLAVDDFLQEKQRAGGIPVLLLQELQLFALSALARKQSRTNKIKKSQEILPLKTSYSTWEMFFGG